MSKTLLFMPFFFLEQEKSSVERIEGDLARARAAIRKAIGSKNYTCYYKEEDSFIPRGSVYRNAYAFHQLSFQRKHSVLYTKRTIIYYYCFCFLFGYSVKKKFLFFQVNSLFFGKFNLLFGHESKDMLQLVNTWVNTLLIISKMFGYFN